MEPVTHQDQASFHENVKPAVKSSPLKNKGPDAGTLNQDKIRPNLGYYNNVDMFVCPIEPFLVDYGPSAVSEATINGCIARLVQDNGVLKRDMEGDYSWVDFKILPKHMGVHEDHTFRPLGKIIDAVMVEKTNNLEFKLVPRMELTSDIRGSTHKINACFFEGQFIFPLQERKIKAPIEGKIARGIWTRAIVHLQVLGACQHILNEDPRRMWIFALTFENSMVSIWYFSRSHSVKALAFDWIKDPRMLIHILLAFARATPVELGVDPTIHVGPGGLDGKSVLYVYEVPNGDGSPLFFKTGKSLVPQRPVCISGRNTRVWEATRVTSAVGTEEVDGEKVILKDVWLDASDEHSKTEAENMDAIFEAVDRFIDAGLEMEIKKELEANAKATRETLLSDPTTVARLTMQFIKHDARFKAFDNATKERLRDNLTDRKYRSMFLTKLHAWKGVTSKVVGQKASRIRNLFNPTIQDDELEAMELDQEYWKDRGMGSENATVVTLQGVQSKDVDDNYRGFAPKQQSRVIYKEVCTTLQNVDTVGDVVDIICQTVDALIVLFVAGWVHRDISSSNILAHHSGPNQTLVLKLADLEFSRPMIDKNRKPRSDPRTGTPFFMPVEIMRQRYLFEEYLLDDDNDTNKTLAQHLGIKTTSKAYKPLSRLAPMRIDGITIPENPNWDAVAQPGQAVNHNFQHDLESVWWILLWIVTCRVHCELSAKEVDHCFKHDINDFKGRELTFKDFLHAIRRSLHADLRRVWGNPLDDLREQMLHDSLVRPIVGHLELPESYSSIFALFSTKLREVQATPGPWHNKKLEHRKKPVEGTAESVDPLTAIGKRSRGASDAEPERGARLRQRIEGSIS